MNHGMTKSAVTDVLKSEKKTLPQPNILPASYKEAKDLIKHLLIPLYKYDVCVNDCVVYRDNAENLFAGLQSCPKCKEPRHLNGKVRKSFTYMPIGPRLARWFGTFNLCQLLYAEKITLRGTLSDFVDGSLYHSWYQSGGVFEATEEPLCVPLSLFTDGVNPNKHTANQKSMWPLILTWINLPRGIRQVIGPMLLIGIIPSGPKGCEPKALEPYLEILIDELLELTEFPVRNAYTGAPATVKVALLQFLCDIPAYSKLLHLSGQAALRSCPYCNEVGHYCHFLKKAVHISNRCFLPSSDKMREGTGFALQERESNIPISVSNEEEKQMRLRYDRLQNKTQKQKYQKETGMKGTYSLMKLPYHNRLQQMQPDGMHTIADFISHVMDMLIGKHDGINVRNCERSFSRFPEIWIQEKSTATQHSLPPGPVRKGKKKRKLNQENEDPEETLRPTPWSLSKEQIKTADARAASITYSTSHNISPGPHFSKPWTLRTMNSKLQFVTSGALAWCIKGFLPMQQEETLFLILSIIKRMVSPTLKEEDIPTLQEDAHTGLSLFERDFPLSMQNLVTHLLHHVVDGFPTFGPLYGRWLFPYERANGWISRQCLKKGAEEATVMETYVVYDWCMYMVMSKKFMPSDGADQVLAKVHHSPEFTTYQFSQSQGKVVTLTEGMSTHMREFYQTAMNINIFFFSESAHEKAMYSSEDRKISSTHNRSGKNSSVVKILSSNDHQFGEVCVFLEHNVNCMLQTWAVIDVFPLGERKDGVYVFENRILFKRLVHVDLLSDPLVYVKENNIMYVLSDI